MSNGENNLLSLFSRFYSLIDKETNKIHCIYGEKDKDDRLMILMDEADMSFHPEWQRKFINLITEFINKFYSEYRVHLIITTHSPIILSDIPSDNIIYLSEGENTSNKEDINNRTFAANIYNLYKERFFWDGYDNDKHFGIIGEFALSKINYVMETLDEYKNFKYPYKYHEEEKNKYIIKLKNCQKIINLIGEPLIGDILDNKYKIAQKELDLKENEDSQIDEIIKNFDKLSGEDRKKFLKHLIDKYK